jgi:hypothetical protein
MVTGVPGGTLLPLGVLVMTGAVGAEFAMVKVLDTHCEYSPVASLAGHGWCSTNGIVIVSRLISHSSVVASPSASDSVALILTRNLPLFAVRVGTALKVTVGAELVMVKIFSSHGE